MARQSFISQHQYFVFFDLFLDFLFSFQARALSLPRTASRGRLDSFSQSVLAEVALFQAQKQCHFLSITSALATSQREAAEKEAAAWEGIVGTLDSMEEDCQWADLSFETSLVAL